MRIRKLMYDSFYVNNESFTGVTSVDSLGSDLYFHYTKNTSGHWKLSGNTAALASGIIFEDSVTTSIVVTPSTYIDYSGYTNQLNVVNQDGVDVITECIFASANTGIVTVNNSGLITIINTGVTTITVTHNDGPTGITTVTGYWPGPVTMTPSVASGITGTTLQFNLISDPTGVNITSLAVWSISATGVTINANTGLATISNTAPNQTAIVTATYGQLAEGGAYMPEKEFTILKNTI